MAVNGIAVIARRWPEEEEMGTWSGVEVCRVTVRDKHEFDLVSVHPFFGVSSALFYFLNTLHSFRYCDSGS